MSSLSEGKWPVCHDGGIVQPLDALYLLFKNKGKNTTGFITCFAPDRFQFPPLRNLFSDLKPFTPDDLLDSLMCLFIASLVVAVGITALKLFWEGVDSKFAFINPTHKKWYVVANISKSFILGCMTLSFRYWHVAYYAFYLDNMIMQVDIKRCGMLYVATDLVATVMVPKLPRSTIMHHITTTLLIIMVAGVDLDVKGYGGLLGVCKMALLYGTFSSFPFLVNGYLALRVVYPKASWLHVLVKLSLWSYILCCACNWSAHLVWLCSLLFSWNLSMVNVLYVLAISVMVNDDIVLIKWLVRRSSPGVGEEVDENKK